MKDIRTRKPLIGISAWRQTVDVWSTSVDIYQIDVSYVNRVTDAGGMPVLIPHTQPRETEDTIASIDALILCGGDDVDPASYGARDEGHSLMVCPEADRCEIGLAREAMSQGVPVLGICRGAQILNVAFGGTLHQEMLKPDSVCHGTRATVLSEVLAQRHPLEIEPGSRLASILGTACREVNTTHHQAIDRVANGFTVSARAPDGCIEAIEHERDHVVGVQWHPEKLPAPDNQELFDELVQVAKTGANGAQGPRHE